MIITPVRSFAACLAGMAAVLAVYFVFMIQEFIRAGGKNVALGPLVLWVTVARPLFWLIAVPVFCLAFWLVLKGGWPSRAL
jgi:hypothetical protein